MRAKRYTLIIQGGDLNFLALNTEGKMLFEGMVTTEQKVIKKWVEDRHGWPAVARRISGTGIVEVLQIGFPECDNGLLQTISWDEFFKRFDRENLVFLYHDQDRTGDLSRSFSFV